MMKSSGIKRQKSRKESETEKVKRGRPRQDYSEEICREYNGCVVESIVDSPRTGVGVEVMARCPHCGKLFRTRLRRLRLGETTSCGCVKKRNYRNYLNRQVSRLAPEVVAGCWISRYMKQSRPATAAEYGLHPAVVDEAQRQYQAKLDGFVIELYRIVSEQAEGMHRPIADIAAGFELHAEATRYVIASTLHRIKKAELEEECAKDEAKAAADRAGRVLAEVALTSGWSSRWPRSRRWRNELTKKELRRTRKGEILGELAGFYTRCRKVDRSLLSQDQKAKIDAFLNLAGTTFENRRDRQLAAIREEKRRKANDQSLVRPSLPVAA